MRRTDGAITKLARMFNSLDRSQVISGLRIIEDIEADLAKNKQPGKELELELELV